MSDFKNKSFQKDRNSSLKEKYENKSAQTSKNDERVSN